MTGDEGTAPVPHLGPTGSGAQASPQLLEVHISVPDAQVGQRLADELVARRLAACVQTLGPMTSTFVWEGEVQRSTELLLVAKTTEASFAALVESVQELHPYDVPEVVAVPITHALGDYGDWVVRHSSG